MAESLFFTNFPKFIQRKPGGQYRSVQSEEFGAALEVLPMRPDSSSHEVVEITKWIKLVFTARLNQFHLLAFGRSDGGYIFVSIDDFIEQVSRDMGQH